eukprot:m.1401558 g.1401558  ORF g.1401558 m.1401558 type:complete len:379 (-) comp25008_c0_seq5:5470-6606(-)
MFLFQNSEKTASTRTASDALGFGQQRQRIPSARKYSSAENDKRWNKEIRSVYIASHKTVEGKDADGNITRPFTLYSMFSLTIDGDEVCVLRRYSDFRSLYEILAQAFPREDFKFPKKRFFRSNFEKEFLLARQQALDAFMNNVLANPLFSRLRVVKRFFLDVRWREYFERTRSEFFRGDSPKTATDAHSTVRTRSLNSDARSIQGRSFQSVHVRRRDGEQDRRLSGRIRRATSDMWRDVIAWRKRPTEQLSQEERMMRELEEGRLPDPERRAREGIIAENNQETPQLLHSGKLLYSKSGSTEGRWVSLASFVWHCHMLRGVAVGVAWLTSCIALVLGVWRAGVELVSKNAGGYATGARCQKMQGRTPDAYYCCHGHCF